MKQIAAYVADYFRGINKIHLALSTLIVFILILFNYYFGLDQWLTAPASFPTRLGRYYLLFAGSFIFTWLSGFALTRVRPPGATYFYLLLMASPLIFSIKVNLQVNELFNLNSSYLNTVLLWPLKSLTTILLSGALWMAGKNSRPFAGLSARGFDARPYLLMLGLMLPLLLLAGQGADFQKVYPKLQMLTPSATGWQKVFFELCYGMDFFTIELFFRGFLVLSFIKYGGSRAVLPMAVFYCTIHFGKPMAECISSYFGGLILGIVVHRTRSIWGGLMVHLGIAWMMEAIGLVL